MTTCQLLERAAPAMAAPSLLTGGEPMPCDDELDEMALDDAPYARPTRELELLARCPQCRVTFSITAEVVEELRQDAVRELFGQRGRPRAAGRTSRGRASHHVLTHDHPSVASGRPRTRSDDRTFYRPHLVVYDPKVELVGGDDPSSPAPITLVHRPCGTPLRLFR